jgi:hypothetical protein
MALKTTINQTTSGDQSPNVHTNGDVKIIYGYPIEQHEKILKERERVLRADGIVE